MQCLTEHQLDESCLCLVWWSRFYQGAVTPVVTEVSHFMEMLLDDCSGQNLHVDPEQTVFLILRVLTAPGWASL